MAALLDVHQVHKWVGEGEGRTEILKGVSLSVQTGEFVAIMGASGSGKSSLLNLVGLLDLPSAGVIRMMGQDTSVMDDDDLAQLRSVSIGFIFQSFNLLSYLNARENIELGMSYARRPAEAGRVEGLLAQVHLQHRAAAYPNTLSGGERQRVAIARALANRPALLLADEPTGALDSTTGVQIMDLLKDLNAKGAAIILVTHDDAIARHAQKVMVMKDGRFA